MLLRYFVQPAALYKLSTGALQILQLSTTTFRFILPLDTSLQFSITIAAV